MNRTVPRSTNLTVQPGDVLGFFAFAPERDEEDGIQFNQNSDAGYDEEQAWYNEVFLRLSSLTCPFPIGPGQILSGSIRSAPVFSLDIG